MQHKTITVNRETLAYFDAGTGDKTLLFLHGAFISKEYWSAQLAHFADDFRVIALDLAGHGSSTHERAEVSIQDLGADVAEFIKVLGLNNVVLIGHSFGSDVLLETVALDPAPIIGLIEVDHLKALNQELPVPVVQGLLASLRADFTGTSEHYARQALLTDATPPTLIAKLLADYAKMNRKVGIGIFENLLYYPPREKELLQNLPYTLHLIHVDYLPTDEDALRTYLGDNYMLHRMAGTCHYPMVEHPEVFNRVVADILGLI